MPCRGTGNGIENQLNPAGNPKFIEDSKEVLFDRVLAQAKFPGHVAIRQAVRHQGNNLFFSRSQQIRAMAVHYPQRGNLAYGFDQVFQLLVAEPDLALANPLNASAQKPERGIGKTEEAAGPSPQGLDDGIAAGNIEEQDLGDLRMRKVEASQRGQVVLRVDERYLERVFRNRMKNSLRVRITGDDVELRVPPQGSDQQLTLHLVGVRDESVNNLSSGRSHEGLVFLCGSACKR